MRLHLGGKSERETRICLAAIVAIMVLTGSAILAMGAHYYFPSKAMNRVVMAMPF
ncbi:MAG: hypothetical protein AB1342_05915 [Pseudomonadota bacterium]